MISGARLPSTRSTRRCRSARACSISRRSLTSCAWWDWVVDLEVMTTNLTLCRPYRFPFESRNFFFCTECFRKYFPERVVRWMMKTGPEVGNVGTEPPWRPWLKSGTLTLYDSADPSCTPQRYSAGQGFVEQTQPRPSRPQRRQPAGRGTRHLPRAQTRRQPRRAGRKPRELSLLGGFLGHLDRVAAGVTQTKRKIRHEDHRQPL